MRLGSRQEVLAKMRKTCSKPDVAAAFALCRKGAFCAPTLCQRVLPLKWTKDTAAQSMIRLGRTIEATPVQMQKPASAMAALGELPTHCASSCAAMEIAGLTVETAARKGFKKLS